MNRTVLALSCSIIAGTLMMRRYPFPFDDSVMQVLASFKPWLVYGLDMSWRVMLFTTPYILVVTVLKGAFIFTSRRKRKGASVLPPFPRLADTDPLQIVVGELHHQRKFIQVENPTWRQLPDRGLYTGLAIFGAIGSTKTNSCMYPFAKQIFEWHAASQAERVGGLVLEVKGDFCFKVQEILRSAGRSEDYAEISLTTDYRYNPLHNAMDAFSVAFTIGSLIVNLHGEGKEPFWRQSYEALVKFVVLLYRVVDDYVTLIDVYYAVMDPKRIAAKIAEGQTKLADQLDSTTEWIYISKEDYVANIELTSEGWQEVGDRVRIADSDAVIEELYARRILFTKTNRTTQLPSAEVEDRLQKLEAVKRWFEGDWMAMKPDLRTSIVTGITGFLSVFDIDSRLKRIFCPPKETYDPILNADGKYGKPLPSWEHLIELGTVLALNFPVGENPAAARLVGVMLKLDFQRAMLARIPRMARAPDQAYRPVLFLCDEYQQFATTGEKTPTGDENFFALSRQAKCIPLVATQSISSLRTTLAGETWRTLLQTFRTKIFLTLTDDFSAKIASELCGSDEQTVVSHSTSESGQDARVGWMSGRLQSHKSSVTLNTNFTQTLRPIFQPRVFLELKNAQSIVLSYDGVSPSPATICYLKPYYLDHRSYFEHLQNNEL